MFRKFVRGSPSARHIHRTHSLVRWGRGCLEFRYPLFHSETRLRHFRRRSAFRLPAHRGLSHHLPHLGREELRICNWSKYRRNCRLAFPLGHLDNHTLVPFRVRRRRIAVRIGCRRQPSKRLIIGYNNSTTGLYSWSPSRVNVGIVYAV